MRHLHVWPQNVTLFVIFSLPENVAFRECHFGSCMRCKTELKGKFDKRSRLAPFRGEAKRLMFLLLPIRKEREVVSEIVYMIKRKNRRGTKAPLTFQKLFCFTSFSHFRRCDTISALIITPPLQQRKKRAGLLRRLFVHWKKLARGNYKKICMTIIIMAFVPQSWHCYYAKWRWGSVTSGCTDDSNPVWQYVHFNCHCFGQDIVTAVSFGVHGFKSRTCEEKLIIVFSPNECHVRCYYDNCY